MIADLNLGIFAHTEKTEKFFIFFFFGAVRFKLEKKKEMKILLI